MPGDNPRWKKDLGIQAELHVSKVEGFVWCEHHKLVHDKIIDVYEAREYECNHDNWLDIYVALDEPRPRDTDEETWAQRLGEQMADPNSLLKQGLEVNIPIPPPQRGREAVHVWQNPDGSVVTRRVDRDGNERTKVEPPPPLTSVQRLADEILAQRQKGG